MVINVSMGFIYKCTNNFMIVVKAPMSMTSLRTSSPPPPLSPPRTSPTIASSPCAKLVVPSAVALPRPHLPSPISSCVDCLSDLEIIIGLMISSCLAIFVNRSHYQPPERRPKFRTPSEVVRPPKRPNHQSFISIN